MLDFPVKLICRSYTVNLASLHAGDAYVEILLLCTGILHLLHLGGIGSLEGIQTGMDIPVVAQGGNIDGSVIDGIDVFQIHYHFNGFFYREGSGIDDAHRIVIRIGRGQLAGNTAGVCHIQFSV